MHAYTHTQRLRLHLNSNKSWHSIFLMCDSILCTCHYVDRMCNTLCWLLVWHSYGFSSSQYLEVFFHIFFSFLLFFHSKHIKKWFVCACVSMRLFNVTKEKWQQNKCRKLSAEHDLYWIRKSDLNTLVTTEEYVCEEVFIGWC